jgi:hypothetical protein
MLLDIDLLLPFELYLESDLKRILDLDFDWPLLDKIV